MIMINYIQSKTGQTIPLLCGILTPHLASHTLTSDFTLNQCQAIQFGDEDIKDEHRMFSKATSEV